MTIPKSLSERRPTTLSEAALITAGVVIIGLTLHLYASFPAPLAPGTKHHFSPAEADRQIESVKAQLTQTPEDFESYVALAMAYYQKGPDHYVEAMNALGKARDLGATSAHLFYYAGVMYDGLGLPDYAVNEYSKYLRHYPNDHETKIRLANLHVRGKRYEPAEKLYKEALRDHPRDATAWFNYAVVNKEKGDYDQALKCLKEVVRIAGHTPAGGLYLEGEIYRLKGDIPRALESFQKELAANTDYIPALEATESILKAQGDAKQARELRKRINELKKQSKTG